MKKVLALVLAVIMVCTMAMAVNVSDTVYSSTTADSEVGFAVNDQKPAPGATIFFNVGDLFGSKYYTETVKYSGDNYAKFVPENNKVTVTFSRGADLVASQGWVRIKNSAHTEGAPLTIDDYRYAITLKGNDAKVLDGKADLAISKIVVKATGKVEASMVPAAGNKYVALGESDPYALSWDIGYKDGGEITITGTTAVPTVDYKVESFTVYSVKEGKSTADNAALKVGYRTWDGNPLSVKIALNAGTTYCVKGAAATNDVIMAALVKNKILKDTDNLSNGTGKLVAFDRFTTESTAVANYTITDAKASYNAYSIAADGTVAKLNATLEDGVMTFSTPVKAVVVVDGSMTTTATAGTTGTGTTTNPGTGANDVVGVAAALAVVALVSGAAISLKK